MIAHVVEFQGPTEVLENVGMDGFNERVLPILRAQPGFEGCLNLLDRERGKLLGVTLWDTHENGELADARLAQEIRQGETEMGAQAPPTVLYDVLTQI
ncbi:MAG: hypothetical protein M3400_11020 [Actinomycetota bacterium]|nr:hypothetical protein [Actinomycetota bacterium]